MAKKPISIAEYLAALPEDRREAVKAVRAVIKKNLPKGYAEGMQYGMIGYFVPHSVYPDGYHCDPSQPLPFASLANQKNHMAIHMMCIYNDEAHKDWFVKAWKKTGKKLDMGKSCIRFRKLEDLPLELIGQAIKSVPVKMYVKNYESAFKRPAKKATTKKQVAKKTATKKTATKKAATKKTTKKKTTKKASARRT